MGCILGPWRECEQGLLPPLPALPPPVTPQRTPQAEERSKQRAGGQAGRMASAIPPRTDSPTTPSDTRPPPRRSARLRAGRVTAMVAEWEKRQAAEQTVVHYEAQLGFVANPVRRTLVLFHTG